MSYKRQELLTIREHLGLPPVFCGIRVGHLFMYNMFIVLLVFFWGGGFLVLFCLLLFVFVFVFVFVLCLVSLDCRFLIAPSVFSNVYSFNIANGNIQRIPPMLNERCNSVAIDNLQIRKIISLSQRKGINNDTLISLDLLIYKDRVEHGYV